MDIRDSTDAPLARRRLVPALLLTLAAWVPAAVSLVLSALYGLPVVGYNEFASLYLLNAVVWGGVSGLLIARRPNPVGVLTAVTAITSAVSLLAGRLVQTPPGAGIPLWFAEHVLDRLWMPGTLVTLSVLPLLLTSRPLGVRTRVLVVVGVAVAVVPLLVAVVRQRLGMSANPFALPGEAEQSAVSAVFLVALSASVAIAIVTCGVLLWRLRRGPADDRRGTGWLLVAQVLQILLFAPTFLPWLPIDSGELFRALPLAPVLALLFMAAAVVVVALGARLWGIESTVNRVVADGLLLVVLLLAVLSIALALSRVIPVPPTIAGMAAVVGVALALEPLRRFLRRRVDALVYGDAAAPTQLLARLGTVPHERDLLDALVAELRVALRLDALEVRPVEVPVPVDPPGRHVYVQRLRSAAGEVGWVRATPAGRQRLDQRTRGVLDGLSGVLAITLQLDEAHRELAEARDRALSVGDEERRMLRRELQDGLEPALASAADRLERLAADWPDSPGAARAELAALRGSVTSRATEVRDLARTLLPGALDAGDLETALHELASRFSGARLAITVSISGAADLDVAQQNAVHHLAAEGVLLLRRAADVRRATLRLEVLRDRAIVELAADAVFAAGPAADVTLRSIADRADELGGRSHLQDAGARVRVEVPR